MSNRIRISGCMIVRNEEANIANCINNLKNVTDEIIVVDTGSEDQTIQIAKDLGAFVYEHKWENDFSKAKNTALEYAKGDWIIFLDADEYFREDSLPKVRLLIQNTDINNNYAGIICEIVNIDRDTSRTISNNQALRIFRNNKNYRYVNKIHEEIRNDGNTLNCINIGGEISIIHTGYSSPLLESKAKRNLELMLGNKEDEKSSYYLATTCFILHDYAQAYRYADLALSVDAIKQQDYLAYKMHIIKISVMVATEFSNKEKIRKMIEEANQKYENHPEIAVTEANYLAREKLLSKALEKYFYALYCQEKYGMSFMQNDFAGSISEVYYNVAQILCLMNNETDALSYYVKILRLNKHHAAAFNSMFEICRSIPENETITFINSIYDADKEEDVKFVLSRVADCGRAKIVLYYANKWNNIFGHEDDVLIYAFLAQKKYLNALEIALLYLKSDWDVYSPLVTSILIMGRLFPEAEKLQDQLGPDFYGIVICCADDRKYTGDIKAYLSVFSILVKFADHYNSTNYLKTGRELGVCVIRDIAEIFLTGLRFEEAQSYFKLLNELLADRNEKALVAFKVGYCFYKQKKYKESLDWFEKAYKNGYRENDLSEYLYWIAGQTSEDEIKRKTEFLRTTSNLSNSDKNFIPE